MPPSPLTARRDPADRRGADCVDEAPASTQTYVAQYTFTRVDAEQSTQLVDAAEFAAHAPRAGRHTHRCRTCSIVWKGRATDCAHRRRQAGVLRQGGADRPARIRSVAGGGPDAGIYDVTPAPAATIAGELRRCFVVRAHVLNKQLPNDFGAESDLCYASDGVPLRDRLYSDRLDELEATQRAPASFDDASLAPVLAGFAGLRPRSPGSLAGRDRVTGRHLLRLGVPRDHLRVGRRVVPRETRRRCIAGAPTSKPCHNARWPAIGPEVRSAATAGKRIASSLVAPFGRTLLYAVVGFVVMIAGLGAMINK